MSAKIPPPAGLNIPNWDTMSQEHPTRMLVYKALVELTLRAGMPPTKDEILEQVREYQASIGLPRMSPKSLKAIQTHLDNLRRDGWVYRGRIGGTQERRDEGERVMGRGGPARSLLPIHVTVVPSNTTRGARKSGGHSANKSQSATTRSSQAGR